jgi:hypothetical protein
MEKILEPTVTDEQISTSTAKKEKIMDPIYKNLENSLRIVYDYPYVYIEEQPKSCWYIPYLFSETRSEADIPMFVEFAKKVMYDYPQSSLYKPTGLASIKEFTKDENISHPAMLKIWKLDGTDINKRATNIR